MISSIEMLRNSLVNIIVPYGTKVFSIQSHVRYINIDPFTTFTAGNAVNHVGGSACKIVPNNEIGFRYRNRCGKVEERTRVTMSTEARKCTRWCLCVFISNGVFRSCILNLKLSIFSILINMKISLFRNVSTFAVLLGWGIRCFSIIF